MSCKDLFVLMTTLPGPVIGYSVIWMDGEPVFKQLIQ